jgi:hypothetical protein
MRAQGKRGNYAKACVKGMDLVWAGIRPSGNQGTAKFGPLKQDQQRAVDAANERARRKQLVPGTRVRRVNRARQKTSLPGKMKMESRWSHAFCYVRMCMCTLFCQKLRILSSLEVQIEIFDWGVYQTLLHSKATPHSARSSTIAMPSCTTQPHMWTLCLVFPPFPRLKPYCDMGHKSWPYARCDGGVKCEECIPWAAAHPFLAKFRSGIT